MPKSAKQGKAKRDDVINPQNNNSNEFFTRKIRCSQIATNQPKSTVEFGYMCLRGLFGPTSSDPHQVVEIQKEISTKMQNIINVPVRM